ncbi:MAG: hypothetical protein AABX03_02370 [Nanoarchaeota archaeon]
MSRKKHGLSPTRKKILDYMMNASVKPTLREAAKTLDITYEAVRLSIEEESEIKEWYDYLIDVNEAKRKLRSDESRRIKQEISRVVPLIKDISINKAEKELGKPYADVLRDHFGTQRRTNGISLKKKFKILNLYLSAAKRGKRLALHEIGEEIDLLASSVGRVINSANLPPMYPYKANKRERVTKEEQEQMSRGLFTPFSCKDIRYFVFNSQNVEKDLGYLVSQFFIRKKFALDKRKNLSIKYFSNGRHLNYRLASQIYECEFAGLNLEETVQYTKSDEDIVRYAKENKARIEKAIIKGLDQIFVYREERLPWVTASDRKS